MLEIRVLGELEVLRDGARLPLPQSKKTRALLAYLVLTQREHRRESLCTLLWDVTDDPRGALRWSLSKLRAIVPKIDAGRERVSFDAKDVEVDALSLKRALVAKPIGDVSTEDLERLARAFRGELLEGLELADFDDYQAWCTGERERARAQRTTILAELVKRLDSDPERAIEHANVLVRLDPMDERARASLVKLLGRAGRPEEARQHYESGKRLAKELGRSPGAELDAALRSLDEQPPSLPRPRDVAAVRAGVSPFVGRDAELAALEGAANDAVARRALVVRVVAGEAGIGKSRLVSEWVQRVRARDAIVLSASSFEAESGRPYAPWIDALASAGLAGDPFAAIEDATATRDRLFARVEGAIATIAPRDRLLVIVLDDVQWLDEGSAELLHWYARRNRDRPLTIVLAARAGELADNAALLRVTRAFRRDGSIDEVPLGPLREDAVAVLVRALGGDADPKNVFARSGGNALFATELARAGASDEVPPSLAELVRDRIAQLPPEAADVLRWISVLGTRANASILEQVSEIGVDPIVRALDQLEARALLVQGTFAHEVVERVVYGDLSEARRRLMHQRVARMLSNRTDGGTSSIADLAHHAALAHDSKLAAESCLAVARRSLRLFANADAFNLARRGARHAEQLAEPSRTRHLIELAEVQHAARRPDDVVRASEQMVALAERALDLGSIEHARIAFHVSAYLSWETGGWADAERHMREAERVSRGGSEPERIRAMAEAARCLAMLERDLGHAHALALEAAARSKQHGVEPPAILDALGLLAMHRGHIDEARARLEQARAIAHATRDHHDEFQALEHLVMLELEIGDPTAALRRAKELAALGERFREGSEAPFARALVALIDGAGADLERALEELTFADAKHRLVYVLTRAATEDARAARWELARARATRALGIAELLGRASDLVLARALLVRCARALGHSEEEATHRRAVDALPFATVAAGVRRFAEDLDESS